MRLALLFFFPLSSARTRMRQRASARTRTRSGNEPHVPLIATINVSKAEKRQDIKPKANENEINFPLRSFSLYSRISRSVGWSDAKISSSKIKQVQWRYCVCV